VGGATGRKTTTVLMKSAQVTKRLYERAVKYGVLNIGGIGSAPDRRSIFENIAVPDEEIAILKGLLQEGVKITLLTMSGE
jgi:PTS system mannose-specific IIB component